MTHETNELLQKALALPDQERAELAGTLIASLDSATDETAEAAWQEEVARRLLEIRSGSVKPVSWDVVQRDARALLNGK